MSQDFARQVFAAFQEKAGRIHARARAGGCHGLEMAEGGEELHRFIDGAIIHGRCKVHCRAWGLEGERAAHAEEAYRASLNL